MRKTFMLIPAAMLAIGIGGVGFVHADSHIQAAHHSIMSSATASNTDASDVQSGDQTAPDTADAAEAPESSAPDADANAPCSGQDEATQTGNCDTQSQLDSQSTN